MILNLFTSKKIQLFTLSLMALFLQGYSQPALAIGGGVVNNGAGLVENTFVFAYRMLPQLIDSCVNTANCASENETPPSAEALILRNISLILKENLNAKMTNERLQFLSESEHPGFFTTGDHETNRIAKTCLNSSCPIYVNLDLLYVNGQPALDYSTITGILIHELGHQTGYADHQFLDALGAKIRIFAAAHYTNYIYPFDASYIEFHQFNHDFPLKFGELYLSKNGQSKRVTQYLLSSIQAVPGWSGFELVNGHYIPNQGTASDIRFEVWAKVYVKNKSDSLMNVQFLQFEIQTDSTGEVLAVHCINQP